MKNECFLMTTGFELTAAALRDQPDRIRELFGALTAAETAAAAEGAVLAMAGALREAVDPAVVEQMITTTEAAARTGRVHGFA